MLANGRPEMVRRAVKSFRAQTYENKFITVWHNEGKQSIGALRNEANAFSVNVDIICHWDSDDWSHPNRIAEQVALLQSSGAECVGYNEMLFWDVTKPNACGVAGAWARGKQDSGEAWIYRSNISTHTENYAIGTSMMYWRSTWEKFQFPDYSAGCDDLRWASGDSKTGVRAVKIVSAPAWGNMRCEPIELPYIDGDRVRRIEPGPITYENPRMIASIHSGNTCAKIDSTSNGGKEVWTRVPQWDAYCREAMKL